METFPELSKDDMQQPLNNTLSERSKQVIKYAVATLSEYARTRNTLLSNVELMYPEDLDEFLGCFFAEVRRQDGSLYSRSAMASLRYGLKVHFNKTCGFDISDRAAFRQSNDVFYAVLVKLKHEGKGVVGTKKRLTSDDFQKLYSSDILSTDNPEGLQNKVFVDIMVHLCTRGRDNLRGMKSSDFKTATDLRGRRYVFLSGRNSRSNVSDDLSSEERMYEQPGSPCCPVLSFEKYISKLNPGSDSFWQKPKRNAYEYCWYEKWPLGKNTLGDKMKTLSAKAGLSTCYTNLCLRVCNVKAIGLRGIAACRSRVGEHVSFSTQHDMSFADSDSDVEDIKPTSLLSDVPDDSCGLKYIEIVPLDTSHPCAMSTDASSDDDATCDICGITMLYKDLNQHRRVLHDLGPLRHTSSMHLSSSTSSNPEIEPELPADGDEVSASCRTTNDAEHDEVAETQSCDEPQRCQRVVRVEGLDLTPLPSSHSRPEVVVTAATAASSPASATISTLQMPTGQTHASPNTSPLSHLDAVVSAAIPARQAPSHLYAEAALALLDQHHMFTEPQLMDYLAVNYPDIPDDQRRPLVVGAVTAAQHAAKLCFYVERNKDSADMAKRAMADDACSALSVWNLGLQVGPRIANRFAPRTTTLSAESEVAVSATSSGQPQNPPSTSFSQS